MRLALIMLLALAYAFANHTEYTSDEVTIHGDKSSYGSKKTVTIWN